MPIHFRCCFCHQLLGIAHRKAGSVIECPTCRGKIWVPKSEHPEAAPPVDWNAGADVEPVRAPTSDGIAMTPARIFFLGLGLILMLALVVAVVVGLLRVWG
jgi:hypothetical protein